MVFIGIAAKKRFVDGLLKTIKSFCKIASMELSLFLKGRKE